MRPAVKFSLEPLTLLVLPCLEIWILIQLTFFMTLSEIILQCVITMVAGFWLTQGENFTIWTLVESELLNRRVPTEELMTDLLLWSGGIFLIVPGLLTDAIGLVIFIPIVRQESIKLIRNRVKKSLGMPPFRKL